MKAEVTKETVVITEYGCINEGELYVNICEFSLPEIFDGLTVTAVFNNIPVPVVDNRCVIPSLEKGSVTLGVYAYNESDGNMQLMYSPMPAVFFVNKGSYTGEVAVEKTPTITEFESFCHGFTEQLANSLSDDIATKQPTLISGENIKTLNGESLLGSGDITVLTKIMTSPDGTKWTISVDNNGNVVTTKITDEIPASGISLSASTLTFTNSANKTLTAILTPTNSTDIITWSSNNEEVAIVTAGVVTPISNGTATITATAGDASVSCKITVNIESGEAVTYTITRNITNATGFDDATVIGEGSELLECYISNDECTMDGATATVTMGGEDITEAAWDNGVVNIAEVTGDVVITLDAVQIQYVVPPIEDFEVQKYETYYLLKGYTGAETAIELPTSAEIDGATYVLKIYGFSTSGSSVKHLKVPADMQAYSNMAYIDLPDSNTVLTVVNLSEGVTVRSPCNTTAANSNTVYEKYTHRGKYAYSAIRTLQGATYSDSMTNMELLYQACTNLVHGGTIPAQVTAMNGTFYGCTNLRRVRIETLNDITYTHNPFYGCSAYMEMELYSESGYWKNIERNNASLKRTYKFIDGVEHNPIIIIGDSLTSSTYGSNLRSLVPNNATVHESAQGGYTSQQIYDSKMMVEPVQQRLPESIVVIWHGTNGYGTDGYDGVTAKMVAALDGNQRYVLIPPTAQGAGDEVYESWVATYGEEHVLSMGDWFANNGYTVSDYLSDGTHFTADGYALVAQAVYEKIQQYL